MRLRSNWERWLDFFVEGIEMSATQALATTRGLLALVTADRDRVATLGRAAVSALGHLGNLGIVAELTQRRRGRLFSYRRYLALLNARPGTS